MSPMDIPEGRTPRVLYRREWDGLAVSGSGSGGGEPGSVSLVYGLWADL